MISQQNQNLTLTAQIEHFFQEAIRPQVQLDGGDIYLVGTEKREDGYTVTVSLAGACVGCGLSAITLHMGVEMRLREKFPEIKKLEVV